VHVKVGGGDDDDADDDGDDDDFAAEKRFQLSVASIFLPAVGVGQYQQ